MEKRRIEDQIEIKLAINVDANEQYEAAMKEQEEVTEKGVKICKSELLDLDRVNTKIDNDLKVQKYRKVIIKKLK